MVKNKVWIILGIILLTGLILRVVYLYKAELGPVNQDDAIHDKIAISFLKGQPYRTEEILSDPSYEQVHKFYPLHPAFLSVVYLFFGHNYFIARLSLGVLMVLAGFLTFLLTRKMFSEDAAIVSAAAVALLPPFLTVHTYLYAEPTYAFTLLIFQLLLFKAFSSGRMKDYFLSGLGLAVTVLCKRPLVYFPLFLFFGLFPLFRFSIKPILKNFSAFLIGFLLLLSPWMAWNYITVKEPLPGVPLTEGIFYEKYRDTEKGVQPASPDIKKEGVLDKVRDPVRLLETRMNALWNLWAEPHPSLGFPGEEMVWKQIIAFGLAGLVLSLIDNWRRSYALLLPFLSYNLIRMAGTHDARHNFPVSVTLVIFAAFAITWLFKKIKARSRLALIFLLLILFCENITFPLTMRLPLFNNWSFIIAVNIFFILLLACGSILFSGHFGRAKAGMAVVISSLILGLLNFNLYERVNAVELTGNYPGPGDLRTISLNLENCLEIKDDTGKPCWRGFVSNERGSCVEKTLILPEDVWRYDEAYLKIYMMNYQMPTVEKNYSVIIYIDDVRVKSYPNGLPFGGYMWYKPCWYLVPFDTSILKGKEKINVRVEIPAGDSNSLLQVVIFGDATRDSGRSAFYTDYEKGFRFGDLSPLDTKETGEYMVRLVLVEK